MLWLVGKLAEALKEVISGILVTIVNWFTDTLSIDSVEFYNSFNFTTSGGVSTNYLKIFSNVITVVACALIVVNLSVRLYRSILSKSDNDVDEPVPLILKSAIAFFICLNSTYLLRYFSDFMAAAWKLIENLNVFNMKSMLTGISFDAMMNADDFGGGNLVAESVRAIVNNVIGIIFGVVLGWKFLKMMFLYVYRYVQYKIVALFAPMGFSMLGSVGTQGIGQSYWRLFASSVVSYWVSGIMTYIYVASMAHTLVWGGDAISTHILWFAVTLGIAAVFNKIDEYLAQIGMNNVSKVAEAPRFPMAIALLGGRAAMGRLRAGAASSGGAFGKAVSASGTSSPTGGGGAGASLHNGLERMMNGGMTKAEHAASVLSGKDVSENADANTEMFKPFLQPQDLTGRDGQPVNDNNSAMAVLSENADGTVNASKISKTPAGQWKNADGSLVSPDDMKRMQDKIDNGEGAFKMANISAANQNPMNGTRFGNTLAENAVKDKDGIETAHGMLNGPDGSYPAEFIKTDDGWKTFANGAAYNSPEAAAKALGANSADVYSEAPVSLDSIKVGTAGNVDNALTGYAGIRGGAAYSPMPENKGFQVVSAGQNEIHGVYADMSNQVHGFSGMKVTPKYASQHPAQCTQIGNTWVRISDGSTNSTVNRYIKNTSFENGNFVNRYSSHSHLNEDGTA